MYHCVHCAFEVVFDDVRILLSGGRCVCLHCFAHLVGDEHLTPKALIRAIDMDESALLGQKLGPDSRMTQHSERPM